MTPMRLIDADAMIAEYTPFIKNAYETNDVLQYTACRNAVYVLKNAPTIDAVPVVRCGECKWARELDRAEPYEAAYMDECLWCTRFAREGVMPRQFCDEGERKESDTK